MCSLFLFFPIVSFFDCLLKMTETLHVYTLFEKKKLTSEQEKEDDVCVQIEEKTEEQPKE